MSNAEKDLSPMKQALLALTRMQAKLDAAERARREPIAIVGMACRFPGGVETPEDFWNLLANGVDAISEVPGSRWNIAAHYDANPDARGKMNTRWGGFLDGVEDFDPQFFGMTPREAVSLDPQQRLLLEVVWEAFENAGQAPDRQQGSATGVYVGILGSDYGDMQLAGDGIERIDTYFGSGTARSMASGRVSYTLGLQGPSVSIDTACSSSLVALHLACQSLRSGETTMAVAAGVNLTLAPEPTIALSRFHMMAPDGRCKTFDRRADGYVRGEACCALVLKTLSAAQAAGDRVLAVIRGSAVNQDGASSGLTAPNGPAQESVIRAALADAGVRPEQVAYVETHGTGTSLGDPIEVQALARVLAQGRSSADPLFIGSVKANIGHTEAAAGLASIIKAVLCLRHGRLPRQLHFEEPNPHIPWEQLAVAVPRSLVEWPAAAPRIAGVSSFGFSGTNAHVVLEAAPAPAAAPEPRVAELLTLSARSPQLLQDTATRAADVLSQSSPAAWAALCHSANQGRSVHPHRLALVAADPAQAATALRQFATGVANVERLFTGHVRNRDAPPIAFLFTGQGSQYAGMGRRLYQTQPVFRDLIERCDALFQQRSMPSILPVIRADAGIDATDTRVAQPALFALEVALAAMWRAWGVEPDAVLGHSLGEYVAAHVAGILTLEDAVRLVATRARLMGALPAGGGMAALLASEEQVAGVLAGFPQLAIAAVNAPGSIVISGPCAQLDAAILRFERDGVVTRALPVSHAFHSSLMDPVLAEFEAEADLLIYGQARLRLISNVTGAVARGDEARTARYWRDHLRGTVRFAAGMEDLSRHGINHFLELGPAPVLSALGLRSVPAGNFSCALQPGTDDAVQSLVALGQLFVKGVRADWRKVDAGRTLIGEPLPATLYQRSRCWLEPRRAGVAIANDFEGEQLAHPLLRQRLDSPTPTQQLRAVLDPTRHDFIADHRVRNTTLLPATGFIELALAAVRAVAAQQPWALCNLELRSPMTFVEGGERLVQVSVAPENEGSWALRLHSRTAGVASGPAPEWELHAVATRSAPSVVEPCARGELAAIRLRCVDSTSAEEHYEQLRRRGYDFGQSLRCVREIRRGGDELLVTVEAQGSARATSDGWIFPPAQFDACLQACWALLPAGSEATYLPMSIDGLTVYRSPPAAVWSHLQVRKGNSVADTSTLLVDVRIYDADGDAVATIDGLLFRRIESLRSGTSSAAGLQDWLYELQWQCVDNGTSIVAQDSERSALRVEELAIAATRSLERLEREQDLAAHAGMVRTLEQLSVAFIGRALRQLGIDLRPGTRLAPAAMLQAAGVAPRYRRLLERFLQIHVESGLASRDGETWLLHLVADDTRADDELRALQLSHPAAAPQLQLFERCVTRLADVLTGAADPLEILFEGGSIDLVETFYRSLPEGRVFNAATASVVADAVRRLPAARRARILEIGAGTGSVTGPLLAMLPPDSVDYVFTDVSPVFLARARAKLSAWPTVRYELLDAEKSPQSQGFDTGSFDIVIAANALHATRSIAQTLGHVRSVLAPHGLLVLLEGTAPERWLDVTFGLTDGWWAFEDAALREDYPLIRAASWCRALDAAQFEDIEVIGSPGELSHQAIVIAQADAAHAAPIHVARPWVLVSDDPMAQMLAATLEARGRRCVCVAVPASADLAAFAQRLRALAPLHAVAFMAVADAALPFDPNDQRRLCGGFLTVIQALAAHVQDGPPELLLVTRGAQSVSGESRLRPGFATLWGMCKVVDLEHPELECRRIDLDPDQDSSEQVALLAAELMRPDGERLVASRRGRRHFARLARHAPSTAPATLALPPGARALQAGASGVLDELRWSSGARRPPGPGEVEIEVHASGLSFRDLMNALAMRSDGVGLGSECAGTIVRVGEGVRTFKTGDPVVALATGSLASFVTVREKWVLQRPPGIGAEQAVTLATTAVTAWHALEVLAQLRAGECVLIHAATGGVGLAAVRIAQARGATVYATAGSPAKRDYLRSIGVTQVFSSRDVRFRDAIQRVTGGRGMDVVLNSLTGPLLDASVDCLAPAGRFIEIGKRDVWSADAMRARRPGCSYHVVDLAAEDALTQSALQNAWHSVFGNLASRKIAPLPMRYFRAEHAVEAFRHMAAARHVGKIVIGQSSAQSRFRPDSTYLVTGASRGLGLLTARWMVEQGARHLVLTARRAPDEAALTTLAQMRAAGANVEVRLGDIGDQQVVRSLIDHIGATMPPLRGIIHAAGVLHDATLQRQDWERFAKVFRPKLAGAWYLHEATLDQPLEFFVLYSSLSGVMGAAGQANHAAANAFLDVLAHHRRSLGLPALSIDWGIWSEVGSAAERNAGERVRRMGVGTISPERGLEVLATLLDDSATQVAVLPIDWTDYLAQWRGKVPVWLSGIAAPREAAGAAQTAERVAKPHLTSLADELAQVPEDGRREVVEAFVQAQVAEVIGLPATRGIDRMQALGEMGLDSMMAVELRNRLSTRSGQGRKLPATLVFDYPTVTAIAGLLLDGAGYSAAPTQAAVPARAASGATDLLAELEAMSDDAATQLAGRED